MTDSGWSFDWDAMERAVTPATKVFLLCNPQNPLGRVFPKAEIERLADFCETHDLVLVSDEIHCDLVFDETSTPHFSGLNLPERFASRTITLLSPSKTWNIAGLGYAYAVIADDSLRRRFTAARGHTLSEINALSYYAAEAAYRHGEPWRKELVAYLRKNRDTLVEFVNTRCPGLSVRPGDATYLAWIDASGTRREEPGRAFRKQGRALSIRRCLFRLAATRALQLRLPAVTDARRPWRKWPPRSPDPVVRTARSAESANTR